MNPDDILKKILDGTLIEGMGKPDLTVGHEYYIMFYYKGSDRNDVTFVDIPYIMDLTIAGPKVSHTGLKKFLSPKEQLTADDDFWMLFEREFIYEEADK